MFKLGTSIIPPRITGNDLPDEIWRVIVTHVEKSHLYSLISLNRTFFNVVLDEKYREVRWVQLDKRFVDVLSRLKSPIISGHVQKLYIRAWFIEYLLKRDALFKPPKLNNELRATIASVKSLLCSRKLSKQNSKSPGGPSSRRGKLADTLSTKQIINDMVRAVEGMTNVTELHFEWRDLPINKDTRVFLISTRTAFTASLRKLVLQAQISNFRELLAVTDFVYIDELNFHFDYTTGAADKNGNTKEPAEIILDPDARDLLKIVVPFIAHRRSILHSLTISSTSRADLSDFWKILPTMPSLRRLGLGISFNKKHLSDSSGILHVLRTHSLTLQHININPASPELPFYSADLVSRAKAASWAPINDELLSDQVYLSGLESLGIPFISLHKTMPLLKRSCDTLTRLRLSDYSLSLEEVASVIGLFSHRAFELQYLHLEVKDLTYRLLEMLASRLPGLYSLALVYPTCPPYELFTPPLDGPSSAAVTDWKLCDIGLYEGRYLPPDCYNFGMSSASSGSEFQLMKMLYKQVPSIRMFKGFALKRSRDPFGPPLAVVDI